MILLYHSIVPDDTPPERRMAGQALTQTAFSCQMRWLAARYQLVSLTDYLDSAKERKSSKRKLIAVTLDDGFDITFQCAVPVLFEMRIPSTIFATTGHLEGGELLWFSYLKALCFGSQYTEVNIDSRIFSLKTLEQRKQAWNQLSTLAKASGDPSGLCEELSQKFPIDPAVKAFYAGMTHAQIKLASENALVELGAHTMTHPFLSQLPRDEQEKEILGSKRILSQLAGKEIQYFAYPGGEYNANTLEVMKISGFKAAFAVIPQRIGETPTMEISRVGVYSQSLFKLQMKTAGVADLARAIGLRVG